MRLTSRPATAEDVRAYFNGRIPVSMRAWVLEVDGEVAGIAGWHFMGRNARVFSEMRKPIPKAAIWRESVKFMRRIDFPAVCEADETSGPFLERLGWVTEDGVIYRWHN